jgi:hypothetical protein
VPSKLGKKGGIFVSKSFPGTRIARQGLGQADKFWFVTAHPELILILREVVG